MGTDWRKVIGAVAPAIGSVLGMAGVPGAAAITAVSKALFGHEKATEAEIATAVAAEMTPEQLAALRAADQQFIVTLAGLSVESSKVDAADRADAREMQRSAKSTVPATLSYALVLFYFIVMVLAYYVQVPTENANIVNQGFGVLNITLGSVFGFWFGSSFGSQRKDEFKAWTDKR